ncbi:MAG: hypothetical protein WAX69_04105 [Victivallales bacterium]
MQPGQIGNNNGDASLKDFEDLVNSIVHLKFAPVKDDFDNIFLAEGKPGVEVTLQHKIDLLQNLIDSVRFSHSYKAQKLSLEDFISGKCLIDSGKILFTSSSGKNAGTGLAPICYQPKLLMYLLLYRRKDHVIYEIIEHFIDKVRPSLGILDFKKTKTGTTRCFTNVRFAANKLREYGFLKFTRREAYKTWELTLPGIAAAANIFLASKDWTITDKSNKTTVPGLSREIIGYALSMHKYDDFKCTLEKICEPNVKVFKSFESILRKIHSGMNFYWSILNDQTLGTEERKEKASELIKQLEQDAELEKFHADFIECLKLEKLIQSLNIPEPNQMPDGGDVNLT